MTLGDIFEHLAYGELSSVFAGNLESGVIRVEDRKRIASHIKLGLTELHKRFLLREGTLVIKTIPDKFTYILDQKYVEGSRCSFNSPEEGDKYILPSEPPYKNDLFKIERVYDDQNHELELNIVGRKGALSTPNYRTLVIPEELSSETLTVKYRQDHPEIEPYLFETAPEHVHIELPQPYLRPLLLFVASRVFDPMGAAGEYHEGNAYWGKFEGACRELVNLNIQRDPEGETNSFMLGGWV